MKKSTPIFLLLAAMSLGGSALKAQSLSEYCQKDVTHLNIAAETASAIKLTISKIDASSMYVEIESSNADPVDVLTVNGGSGASISAADTSVPGKIRRTLTFSSTPPTNVSIELLWSKVSMGGNWMLNTFSVPFDASCNVVVTDTTAPVMGTATVVGSPAYNSVNLQLLATDNVTSPVTKFIANDATNGISNKALTTDNSGNVSITGLNPATTYNLVITAKDAVNNISANSTTVSFTTPTRISECSGQKGHFATPAVTRINYSIQYAGGNVIYTITPIDAARTIDYAEVQTSVGYNGMTIAADGKSATYTKTGLTSGTNVAVRFMYSLDNLPGNEMTSQDVTLSDVNAIYYKVGDCPVADTEIPTAFTASSGTTTSSSIILKLNATDNLGVIQYTISYGSGPTVLTTTGVSGTEKSYTVSGLTPATSYTFSIIAKDAAGNAAANNPLTVTASTTNGLSAAAPTPTKLQANVISIFSDAYTPITGTTNFNPGWGQSTVFSAEQIGGNNMLKYANLNYQGTNFGSDVDASTMSLLHVDVWTEDETSLKCYVISHTAPTEKYVQLTPLTLGSWNSYDIPLSSYTSQGMSMASLFQFKFEGSGGKTVYLDNLYFSNDVSTAVSSTTGSEGVNCYPNPAKDELRVSSAVEMKELIIRNLMGQAVKQLTVTGIQKTIDLSDVKAGNYIVTVKLENGQQINRKITKQ